MTKNNKTEPITKADLNDLSDKERDKSWKFKIINILEREKLAKPQELEILANLI